MRQKMKGFSLLCLCICLLAGCKASNNRESSAQLFAMDTFMDLKAQGANGQKALEEAVLEIHRLDELFSVANEKSEVHRINENAGKKPVAISREMEGLLETAKQINEETKNAFAVTIYPVVDAWGFMKEEKKVPDEADLQEALTLVDDSRLVVDSKNHRALLESPSMAIDLGGIAKGYLSDRVSDIMKDNGVSSAMLSLGGNISAVGSKPDGAPWRIALQDPLDEKNYIGIFEVSDISVITSGGYQRNFEENGKVYHHILDPNTGYPAESGLLSVSIVCESGVRADALSTALYVMGFEKGVEYWQQSTGFEVVWITEDKRVIATEGLKDSFLFESGDRGYTYETISKSK